MNRKNNIIVAGHQRTKTSKLLGIEKIPVLFVEDMEIGDEIKFNQIHNITDTTLNSKMMLENDDYPKEQYVEIDNKDFGEGDTMATCVKEICKLMVKYGNVLSCVICKNEVIIGREYVKACKLLGQEVNSYICDDSKYETILHYFGQQYGEYYYSDLEKKTYVQGLAQMFRSVEKQEGKRSNGSALYKTMVLPYMSRNPESTVLDFGCGKGAYVRELAKNHIAIGVEFYNNNGKAINTTKGNSQIDKLIEYLKEHKTFDVCVCDSVLNSVDSMEAEYSILSVLNLFTRNKLFISGRGLKFIKGREKLKRDSSTSLRYLEFLDAENFTANYRQGQWYYQHFHTKEKIISELEEYGFEVVKYQEIGSGSSFQVECNKVRELPKEQYIKGIDFEFNLPLPNNKRYNRHEDVKKALGLC